MPPEKGTVLAVDDDAHMLRVMQRILQLEGYHVVTSSSGEAALDTFDEASPDLVLLDIMMPGMDGYTVCQHIREFSQTPIIMVSVKYSDRDEVQGFAAGADDYVTKPFRSNVLAARVRAMLHRAALRTERPERAFCCQDLVIDFACHRVTVEGWEVHLTATEYRLLSYLARNAGRLLTPDQILEKVCGERSTGQTHLLQVNISRLRRKLGESRRNPKYILTRPGIGYMMGQET